VVLCCEHAYVVVRWDIVGLVACQNMLALCCCGCGAHTTNTHSLHSPCCLATLIYPYSLFSSIFRAARSLAQVVLSDLQDLRASWDEEGSGDQEEGDGADELTPAEAALVQQLSSSPLMPDDFHR